MNSWINKPRLRAAAAGIVFLAVASSAYPVLAEDTKRVMLLHSFGREIKPWSDYAQSIRSELQRQSPWPLDIIDHSLVSARSDDPDPEPPFVEYLRALFAKRPLDLIVSVGAPAAAFVQRHRQGLFAATPMVFTVVDQRRVQYSILTANDAVVPIRINYVAAMENILSVLPDTKSVMVVVGTSPIEQFWRDEIRKDVVPFVDRLVFAFTDDLSFENLLKRAAVLPPHSVIFWELMIMDAAKVVHGGDAAFKRLHAVANAPMFGYYEPNLGQGLVGGPYTAVLDLSRETAAVAVRIFGGEKAGDIRIAPIEFAKPRFDWREMQRWGINESRLPSGSTIDFRDPTAWDRYHVQILTIGGVLLMQAALITWLLYERRRRYLAEVQSRNSLAELAVMNRRASAGQLSASIAHEVNQPLTGITSRAGAALRWLRAGNVDKVEESLEQIVVAGHRASDIVRSVRAMFRSDAGEKVPTDINQLILTVLSIVRIEIDKMGITLQTQLNERLPNVLADKVQLQQVILNLIMNAVEAMELTSPRVLKVQSDRIKSAMVQVSIEDTGPGIDPSNLDRVFQPLFTTKASGMGMGLSICRSIIDSHGGQIWLSPGINGGSAFHFELPTIDTDSVPRTCIPNGSSPVLG
jgi:signal transduction histidine kinase